MNQYCIDFHQKLISRESFKKRIHISKYHLNLLVEKTKLEKKQIRSWITNRQNRMKKQLDLK